MVRYVGYLLVALMALAMTAGVGLILFGDLAERLSLPGAVRLVAFDAVAVAGVEPPRVRAFLQDLDYNQPMERQRLITRFADGRHDYFWVGSQGMGSGTRRTDLGVGRHGFTVSFPTMSPRLDVQASGSLWVLPPGVPVVWVDTAALLVDPAAQAQGGARPEVSGDALDAVKVLAVGRQVLYLVASGVEEYAAIRRQVEAAAFPPGPAVWVRLGEETSRLEALKRACPNVEAAIVCRPTLAESAAKLKVPVWRVPRAAPRGTEPAEPVMPWREVLERLPSPQGDARGAGGVR